MKRIKIKAHLQNEKFCDDFLDHAWCVHNLVVIALPWLDSLIPKPTGCVLSYAIFITSMKYFSNMLIFHVADFCLLPLPMVCHRSRPAFVIQDRFLNIRK